MIENAQQQNRTDQIKRLVALPPNRVEVLLIARGLSPESVEDAEEGLKEAGVVITIADAMDASFAVRDGDLPHGIGRFSDGSIPVFYSALEDETCVAEMKYWCERVASPTDVFDRYYDLLECTFLGVSLQLVQHAQQYPDLVSVTEAGYPFCRAVATWAKLEGAQALHTASARRSEGVCVPVFIRSTLSDPKQRGRFHFEWQSGALVATKIGAS